MIRLIDDEIIKKSISSQLEGCDGRCYIDNDKIVKVYKKLKNKIDLVDLSNYKSSSIAFPLYYLEAFNSNYIAGEVMKFHDKFNINKSFSFNTNIDMLISNYYAIIYEIKKFREICMNDMFSGNILYDEKSGFSIIDTYAWIINEYKDYSMRNISCLSSEIGEIVVEDYMDLNRAIMEMYKEKFLSYGNLGKEFYNLVSLSFIDGDCLIELLELYRELVLKVVGVRVETLNDIKNSVKVLKKVDF